jgi:copper homeostasis protein
VTPEVVRPPRVALEFAVEGPRAAMVAADAGADRIELCSALVVHGVTPSFGAIEGSIAVGLPVHVLIRPRPGGFEFDDADLDVMCRDAAAAVRAGAAGLVIGGLRRDAIDVDLVRGLREVAGGTTLTFHRAFDQLSDPIAALDTLIDLGVSRVLTSGGAEAAADATPALRRLVEHADGRIQIMAGGGVTAADAAALIATGVDAMHASARSGGPDATIDPQAAAALRAAVDSTDALTPEADEWQK